MFNRGAAFAAEGDRFAEMRAIVAAMDTDMRMPARADLMRIPDQYSRKVLQLLAMVFKAGVDRTINRVHRSLL